MGRNRLLKFLQWIGDCVDDLSGVIFPHVCEVCAGTLVKGEDTICLQCRYEMPRVRLHREEFSEIHRRLAGHAAIDRAASWFYYIRESPYARMLQRAKYNSRPQLARTLGAMYAGEIRTDGFFDGIDIILPVAMHRWKKLTRGYNQAERIAQGISDVTGIPVATNLTMPHRHRTQTRRRAYERWLNTRGIFHVDSPAELQDKHILLVDDIITTGATLHAAAEAIHNAAPTARISVISLGLTHSS